MDEQNQLKDSILAQAHENERKLLEEGQGNHPKRRDCKKSV